MWIPSPKVARRCGAHMLVCCRAEGIDLNFIDEQACVDACSNVYLSRNLCRKMGVMWIKHGRIVLAWNAQQEKPPIQPKKIMDEALANVLQLVS